MKKLLVLIAVMSVTGFAGEASGITVHMTDSDAFVPMTLTIKAGGTVVWKNDSQQVHTVTDNSALASAAQDSAMPAGAEPFNSGTVEPGKQYLHTFAVPGTYKYFCLPHEAVGMVGTIVVTKSEAEAPFYDTGHFALETNYPEIASAIRDFLDCKLTTQGRTA